jgi:hypothetical protein
MTDMKPELGPYGLPVTVTSENEDVSMPTEIPPAVESSVQSAEIPMPFSGGIGDSAPSLPVMEGVTAGITAWQNNKRITGLWSINQNRNSWVGVSSGIGWKKLANNSDSAIVALTMLSSHAREKGSVVNYREESDGMIHEMYVW